MRRNLLSKAALVLTAASFLAFLSQLTAQEQDTTPPVLTGFTFSPMAVNTTTGPATVPVTQQITDDLAGVSGYLASTYFVSPSGNHQVECGPISLISGTGLNGTWQCQMSIPAYSEAGMWTAASVTVRDNVGNSKTYTINDLQTLGFPTTLQVTSNPDTTPPVLTGFTFSPTTVTITTSSAMFTVTEQITDDLSGVTRAVTYFRSPSGNLNHQIACALSLISGTALNGTWQCQISVPAYSEAGTWTASSVWAVDTAGNSKEYLSNDLQALSFPTILAVNSTQAADIEPPVLMGFAFAPVTVDTSTSSAVVTVIEQITDDLSGVAYVPTYFISPSGKQSAGCGLSLISGTALNGTWQCQISVPADSEAGAWTGSSVYVRDNIGNFRNYTASDLQALGFPTQLFVNVNPDHTPPVISGMPISGCSIWPPNHKLVRVATVTATDTGSGLANLTVSGTKNDSAHGKIVITGGPTQYNIQLEADQDEVYNLTATATDNAGNTATVTATCIVPHDQGSI